MRVICRLALLLLCSPVARGVDFSEIRGQAYNLAGLDLSDFELEVRAECRDASSVSCGKAAAKVVWDAVTLTYLIPAISVGPEIGKGDPADWGNRYEYSLRPSSARNKAYVWAHDLEYMSWEANPSSGIREMLADIADNLRALTFFAVDKAGSISFPLQAAFSGKEMRLLFQKHFFPVTKHASDSGKSWHLQKVGRAGSMSPKAAFVLPPTIYLVRGSEKDYGRNPRVRTMGFLYMPDTRNGAHGMAFQGSFDDGESIFDSEKQYSGAKGEITLSSPHL